SMHRCQSSFFEAHLRCEKLALQCEQRVRSSAVQVQPDDVFVPLRRERKEDRSRPTALRVRPEVEIKELRAKVAAKVIAPKEHSRFRQQTICAVACSHFQRAFTSLHDVQRMTGIVNEKGGSLIRLVSVTFRLGESLVRAERPRGGEPRW